nr:hypothetical protein [Tanacetum cinerariifolium]
MNPTLSHRRICLGERIYRSPSEKVEGHGDWIAPEYTDTAVSKEKKVSQALSFYKMETEEVSERYIRPCFVNSLDAYDGEINLVFNENLILNEYAVKLCLDYEVKKGNKEDNVEPEVILGRSFMMLVNEIINFGSGMITVYPHQDLFEDDYEKTEKSMDDWDQLFDFNFDDIPQLDREELLLFLCKMGKSSRNKKRTMENLNLFYPDIRPSSSTSRHFIQEEVTKEALELRISQKFALLEEVRRVLETMAYNDKYKKVLDEIWKDKVELDGMIMKEEEEAINKVKGEELKEKDDPGAFIFPIRFKGKINENALDDIGLDINTMPYRIMRMGVTIIIGKFLILDIPIDRDAPIVRTAESDSDDEEEYEIKRNKFGAPIYGPKPAAYLNCNDPAERSLALQSVINPF